MVKSNGTKKENSKIFFIREAENGSLKKVNAKFALIQEYIIWDKSLLLAFK